MSDEPALLRPHPLQCTPLRLTIAVATHAGTLTSERPVLDGDEHGAWARKGVRRMLEMLRVEEDDDGWAVAWQVRHLADPVHDFNDVARGLARQAAARLALGQTGWPGSPPRTVDERSA